MRNLTVQRLKEVLDYDPGLGLFTWRLRLSKRIHVGDRAGSISSKGYWIIKIDGELYRSARLVWLYMTGTWPATEVDHRDCNKLNDRWSNLRLATSSQQRANTALRLDNTTGFKGVCRDVRNGRWQARVVKDRRLIHLGVFDTPEEASAAYQSAARQIYGEFARLA